MRGCQVYHPSDGDCRIDHFDRLILKVVKGVVKPNYDALTKEELQEVNQLVSLCSDSSSGWAPAHFQGANPFTQHLEDVIQDPVVDEVLDLLKKVKEALEKKTLLGVPNCKVLIDPQRGSAGWSFALTLQGSDFTDTLLLVSGVPNQYPVQVRYDATLRTRLSANNAQELTDALIKALRAEDTVQKLRVRTSLCRTLSGNQTLWNL